MSTAKVALTADIKFKGKYKWFDNITTITDLGGCDNLMDENFAKHDLKMTPVTTDPRTFSGVSTKFITDKWCK
jgi:hypothetical protein